MNNGLTLDVKKAHTGKVKWFNKKKGHGFIEQTDLLAEDPEARDAFVHYSYILSSEKYKILEEGQIVLYNVDDRGLGPIATCVVVIEE